MPIRPRRCTTLLSVLLLFSCSASLDTKGKVAVSLLARDEGLAAAAKREGIEIVQRTDTFAWQSRLARDSKAGSTAQLYSAEWNGELFSMERKGLLAATEKAWKRSETGKKEPPWLAALLAGPREGFIPTEGYLWGLFFNEKRLAELKASPPSTIAELDSLFAKAKAAGIRPIALGAAFGWPGAAWFTLLDLRENGANAVRERYQGKRPWDDAGARAVANRLAAWRDKGYFSSEAKIAGMPESMSAMESGSCLCVLMGANAADRLTGRDSARFVAFPRGASASNAEIGAFSGFVLPKSGFGAKGKSARILETTVDLVDAYIIAGYRAQGSGSYKVPLAYLMYEAKDDQALPLPELSGIPAYQAKLFEKASEILPSFERAVQPQAVQNAIALWSSFFVDGGPSGQDFVESLQRAIEAGI